MCRMKGDKRPVPAPPSASRNPELEPRTCYDSQSPSPQGSCPGHPSCRTAWPWALLPTWTGVAGAWALDGSAWALSRTTYRINYHLLHSGEWSLPLLSSQSTYTSLVLYTKSSTLYSQCHPSLFSFNNQFWILFRDSRVLAHSFYGCVVLHGTDLPLIDLVLYWWTFRFFAIFCSYKQCHQMNKLVHHAVFHNCRCFSASS